MSDAEDNLQTIKTALAALAPTFLKIIDESESHAGHFTGTRVNNNPTHIKLIIVSSKFVGMNKIARHKLIYKLLQPLLETSLHAVSIQAYTPLESW